MKTEMVMESSTVKVDLNDYYSGGYFLVKADKPHWPQWNTDLLPSKVISLSRCITSKLGVYWGWIPGDRSAALQFGIPEDRLDEFILWCSKEASSFIEYPSVFYSVAAVRDFIERFLPNTRDLYIVGVGLPKAMELQNAYERSRESIGISAVEQRLEERLPLEDGGVPVGFEVTSFQLNDFSHSWLCSGLDRDMHDLFDIRPNQYGLINTYEEAKQVYEWIAEDKMQGRRAEPEPYNFWLLVSYPLSADGFE